MKLEIIMSYEKSFEKGVFWILKGSECVESSLGDIWGYDDNLTSVFIGRMNRYQDMAINDIYFSEDIDDNKHISKEHALIYH